MSDPTPDPAPRARPPAAPAASQPSSESELRILMLEDRLTDAELIIHELRKTGLRFVAKRVLTEPDFLGHLDEFAPDLILADYSLPTYDGLSALDAAQARRPDIPFIFVSGTLGEETAIEALHHGATDYVLKQRLTRLGPAVRRAMREVRERTRRQQAESALRRSEQGYREIFNATHDAIFVHDAVTGEILDVNQTMLEMYGYAREDLPGLSSRIFQLEGAYSQQEALHRIHRVFAEGPEVFEWLAWRKSGECFWTEVALRGTSIGGEGRVLAVVRDITEHKRLEENLRQAQKMEAIGQLAGGVAHDFNNILAAILMHLGLLQTETNLAPEMKASLKELETDVQRGTGLTRQLLLFSRRQVLQVKPLDLNQLLAELLKMLRRLLGEAVEIVLQPSAPRIWIEADAGMIEQLVMNLSVNARDAMPGGGRITITTAPRQLDAKAARLHPEARAGDFVCLTVADTGCGMDAATRQHIFEPFFTTKAVGKGTGLGLATVHGIVRQHQGWIEVESAPGRGTVFQVLLPALSQPPPTAPADQSEGIPGGRETILLVEDEPAVRGIAARALRRFGYRVLEAGSGPEALGQWESAQDQIDLLLSDMVMPGGLTGLELAEQLRKTRPGLSVILTSGHSPDVAQLDEKKLHSIAYLAKPYAAAVLAQTVRRCLDQR